MSTANLESSQQLLEQQYDSTVRADIEQFRTYAKAWMAKEITDDQFRATIENGIAKLIRFLDRQVAQ